MLLKRTMVSLYAFMFDILNLVRNLLALYLRRKYRLEFKYPIEIGFDMAYHM